jgi:hypothetical protein
MSILRSSKWNYQTGSTAGVSIEFVVASGGDIALKDPGGQRVDFHYGGIGLGMGGGIRLSKIKVPKFALPDVKVPRIAGREMGGAGSLESFNSGGFVYMTSAFRGSELSRSDFQGATVYVDAGGGLGYGKAASAMILGINPAKLALGLSSPAMAWLAEAAIAEAPAVLIMYGTAVGMIAGWGAGVLVGYLH